ncbi:hypothetical protein ACFY3U_15370 [Micromonospora sp. NPDC000089]
MGGSEVPTRTAYARPGRLTAAGAPRRGPVVRGADMLDRAADRGSFTSGG